MKVLVVLFCLISLATANGVAPTNPQSKESLKETSFVGRWNVKFALMGGEEKNLVLIVQENGVAVLELKDTGPDNKPVPTPQPAVWSKTLDSLSVTTEVELPTGTCCRATGTLIFKAKAKSTNSISGRLIFVTNIEEDESPYKFHSTVGTFTATRSTDK